jgi:hypothetical protein
VQQRGWMWVLAIAPRKEIGGRCAMPGCGPARPSLRRVALQPDADASPKGRARDARCVGAPSFARPRGFRDAAAQPPPPAPTAGPQSRPGRAVIGHRSRDPAVT